MGCHDFTDGEWIWPEGLAHYVEKHDVRLPDAFIGTMEKNSWLVPSQINIEGRSRANMNSSYWVNWASEYVKSNGK